MYINIHRIQDKVHCGEVNIPFGTEFDVDRDGFIYTIINGQKKQICWETSERAYKDFAWNDDGNGEERKDLIHRCIDEMKSIDKSIAFGSLFYDPVAMRYKKNPFDHTEWSWDRLKIHKAPIEDLEYLLSVFKSMPKMINRW